MNPFYRHADAFAASIFEKINRPIDRARPHVTLTFAQSLDGRIAGKEGRQLILSGKESMAMTHRLRTLHDAILVGIGTVLNDDPRLTARLIPDDEVPEHPRPIILDSSLRFPLSSRLLSQAQRGEGKYPWIFCSKDADATKISELEKTGALIFPLNSLPNGRLDLSAILATLHEQGIRRLMVEGGATIIQAFLIPDLVDLTIITIAPVFVGSQGVLAIGTASENENSQTEIQATIENPCYEQFGFDMVIYGKLRYR